ncbi:hypothetical protein [Dyadobacter sp. CY323]|uniref:hypothetical protein n=1 Tax=Dyadobacter sp. CY323 TaxID=2907302 RepID=UPI001F1BBFFD|nr:hypothetical protein [Dyadobacter sp. CY323]MCE6989012.1 hypothetical protein [Dyadobacter sp. CY323]
MALSNKQVELARRLRQENPLFDEYSREWRSFNACYNGMPGKSERLRVMNTVFANIAEDSAAGILAALPNEINYFTYLPPGNLFLGAADPKFRSTTTADLQIINDPNSTAVKRLSHFAAVLYQIRCNITHAGKDPIDARDNDLLRFALAGLKLILAILLK